MMALSRLMAAMLLPMATSAMPGSPGSDGAAGVAEPAPVVAHPYVGMWVTADGYIRHELLPNGRYDEARGARRSAYQGRYTITGDHIDYVDDTGFTADGDFIDGVLHHAGMVLRRETVQPPPGTR
ncbi:MAG: Atu4866 domain-containing protein [Hydrogenophaga sp.]|nr:Atu4866 domain-containing protein [Hydrogenophaga sp.]